MADGPTPPNSSEKPWTEPANNKHEKRRRINGQTVGRNKRSSTSPRKKQTSAEPSRIESLIECFHEIDDPRINRRKLHLLIDIIVISVCAVICNADTWKDIATWGETHQEWLEGMLELPEGIPSRDTFRRTISRIDPDAFQQAFIKWLSGLRAQGGDIIAIDGKTLRGTKCGGNSPLHIVSAWASSGHVTLGQRQVDGKSNEITAIPELLKTLQLKGAIVTIDAMGCQKEIAKKIVDGKGDFCLAVKGNQEKLFEDIQAGFEDAVGRELEHPELQYSEVVEPKRPHGRYEERHYYTMPVPKTLRTSGEWTGLKSIGVTVTYRGESPESPGQGEVRYYIMSFKSDVTRFAEAVRGHWGIENALHWVMDVTFREDESRIKKDHGGENVSWLRRLAITLIKNENSLKDSIRSKRIRAGYDTSYLEKILAAIPAGN